MKSYKKMVTSEKETTRELYDAIKEGGGGGGTVVDVVEKGNMNAVTSNAVACALDQTGTVKVITSDFITGEFLDGVVVKLDNETKTTDSSGECIFTKVTYGTHIIKITNTGYDDLTDSIFLEALSYTYNAELVPSDAGSGTINITVLDETSQEGISNASVKIGTITAITDTSGKCTFKDLKYGVYNLQVSHDNYETVYNTIKLKESSMDLTVEMKADDSKGTLNISVIDSTTLEGVKLATVKVGDNTQVTDETGNCTFKNLKYNQYNLSVEHEDYNTYSSFININKEETNITIKLSSVSKLGAIHLTVLDSISNDPVVNASVTINNTTKVTGATGECTFENLPYSTYIVKIECDKYDKYLDTITLNKEKVDYTAKLVSTLATVEVTVSDDTSKKAIPNASVTINEKTLTTDSNGKCTFSNMDYGDYTVNITHYGYNDYSDVVRVTSKFVEYSATLTSSLERGTVNVTVTNKASTLGVKGATVNLGEYTATTDSDGNCTFKDMLYSTYTLTAKCSGYEAYSDSVEVNSSEVDVSVRLIPISGYLTFKGQVTDKQGALEQVQVTINNKYTEYSDADGNYTVLCPANINEDIFALTFSKQYYASLNVNIPKIPGQSEYEVPTQELELNSYPLSGNVIASVKNRKYNSEEYEPSKKVKLLLKNTRSLSQYTPTSDEYGQVLVQNLSAGTYDLMVGDGVTYKSETQTDVFYIRPNQTLDNIEFILTKLVHEFNLTVHYNDGSAVINRKIEIHEKDKTEILASGTTDEYGEFIFDIANEPIRELSANIYITDTQKITNKNIGSSSLTEAYITISNGAGDIDIKVLDLDTGSVIENATVILNSETKTTDSEGKCSFENLEYGTHDLKITHKNYNEYTSTVTIDSDHNTFTANICPTGMHTYTITAIYKNYGTPASWQRIRIHENLKQEVLYSGITDPNGQFRFAVDNNLDIILQARFYFWEDPIYYEGFVIGSSKGTEATCYLGSIEALVEFTVYVYDEDTQEPLPDSEVTIDGSRVTEITDNNGKCVFKLPYGTHSIYVTHAGYTYYESSNVIITYEPKSMDIYIIKKTGTIHFIVTDKDTLSPITNATVTLNDKVITTDDYGYAIFEKIPWETTYSYTIDHEDYDLYKGAGQVTDFRTEIYAGLTKTNKVTFITIDDTTGNLISNAKIVIEGQSGYTDENGRCTIHRINIGTHNYAVFHDFYEILSGTIEIIKTYPTITLKLTPKTAKLKIVTSNKITYERAPNVSISLTEEVTGTAATYSGVTDEKGICEFNVKCGTYTSLAKHDYFVVEGDHITVKADYTYNITLKPKYSDLTLQFVDNKEQPIEGVEFTFGEYNGVSDANGEFSFTKIYTSQYTTYDLSTYKIEYYDYNEENVQVNSIKQIILIQLLLGYATVKVNVYDKATGLNVQDALVSLGGISATTLFLGQCTLNNVPYTASELTVTHKDYDDYVVEVDPIHDLEYHFDIQLVTSKSRGTCNFTIMDGETRELIDVATIYVDNIQGTTSKGKCSIKNIIYGTHNVRVSSIGYNQLVGSLTLEKSSDTYIYLLNETTSILEITLIGADNNLYIPNATVTLDDVEATTDEEGKCIFNGVKYGNRKYTVSHPYYIDIHGTINVHTTKSYAKITPQSQYGKVIVTVLDDSSGEPVADCNVSIDTNMEITTTEGKATFDAIYYADSHKLKVTNSYYATKEETISVTQERTEITIKITHW